MKSSNIEEFNLLVDEYLKQDSRYERQIRNFQSFLKEYGLEDKVFNLYEDNINDFFEYAVEHNIGTDAQLSIHIAALKGLFSFLIDNNRKFSELNGYISTASFRERLSNSGNDIWIFRCSDCASNIIVLCTYIDAGNVFRHIFLKFCRYVLCSRFLVRNAKCN